MRMNKTLTALLALIAVLVVCLIFTICFAVSRKGITRKETSDTVPAEPAAVVTDPDSLPETAAVQTDETAAETSVSADVTQNSSQAPDVQTETAPADDGKGTGGSSEASAPESKPGGSKQIAVTNILQCPELPTGCETTALTILLNHMGYGVDKLTLARQYLPKLDFYWDGDVYYGADFRTTFAGDPEDEYSYGCYAPCIVTAANAYLSSVGAGVSAYDETGSSFDSLLTDYIDHDIPVLIWVTSSDLHETELTSTWVTPEGETIQWVAYEHCVVLTGYDMESQTVYVSDPLVGNTSYDMSRIRQRYADMGHQCVRIG